MAEAPALNEAQDVLAVAGADSELLQQFAEADVGRTLVGDEPHGPFGGMGAHVDDGAREALVRHEGHRNQELTVEKAGTVAFASSLADAHA